MTTQLDEEAIQKAHEMLPGYMIGGLMRYINSGIQPGDFLQAVLKNNLMDAFSMADETNGRMMREWARWLYNYAPSQSFGSTQRYAEWISHRGLLGTEGEA